MHAYLLTGPRGVGKTSVARILAHAVNKVQYPADRPYVDIIEIDAASNRRIDEIRELRERVIIAPTSLIYKVYIIDEVHMLTREAFNALLKTLEEPPDHAIFILATTDVHKVPDTITSRCVRFHFRPIDPQGIKNHLSSIAKNEKIIVADEALQLIADSSDGSFRDAIALLDQIRVSDQEITIDTVISTLGLGSEQTVQLILKAVISGEAGKVLSALEQAYAEGASEKRLAHQLIQTLRTDLTAPKLGMSSAHILNLIENLLDVEAHGDVRTALELALLKSTVIYSEPVVPAKIPPAETPDGLSTVAAEQKDDEARSTLKSNSKSDLWQNILDDLKTNNRSLYSIARMAEAQVSGDELNLNFGFSFHAKQIEQAKNRQALNTILEKLEPNIKKITISYAPSDEHRPKPDRSLKDISNIFGASEVLES